MPEPPPDADVLVVGAGLAGLTAARTTRRAGLRTVVLERSDGVGGRTRTDRAPDGTLIDRGFQVVFPAYPAYRRQFGPHGPDLAPMPSSAVSMDGAGPTETLGDPLRDPEARRNALRSRVLSRGDLARLVRLAAEVAARSPAALLRGPDEATADFLERRGFSRPARERFFAPFFGGIFLDRTLAASSRAFRYYLRMLLAGGAARPVGGIVRLAWHLAQGTEVRTGAIVRSVEPIGTGGGSGAGVAGTDVLEPGTARLRVRTSDGGELRVGAVVVATDPAEARRLTSAPPPVPTRGATYLTFTGPAGIDRTARIRLGDGRPVQDACWLSNVDPSLVPPGRALLSVTVLDDAGAELADGPLERAVRGTLARWYGQEAVKRLRLADLRRIPRAVAFLAPGAFADLPSARTSTPGVVLACETVRGASVQAALEAGERAAAHLLGDGEVLARPVGG